MAATGGTRGKNSSLPPTYRILMIVFYALALSLALLIITGNIQLFLA